jgi:hypothetical protein
VEIQQSSEAGMAKETTKTQKKLTMLETRRMTMFLNAQMNG